MSESLDSFSLKLSDIIENYSDDVKADVEKKLDETASEVLNYIKENCPRSGNGNNHLADSFILTTVGSGANKTIFISSGTKGRLVHLVELGFKHKSGKFVMARPFMRPAYETFTPEMLEEIKQIIRNGGN
jgi:hypothetical protein